MEILKLENVVRVYYSVVDGFPSGIQQAFEHLIKNLPDSPGRSYYGIFHQDETGKMIYKAAAEIIPTDKPEIDFPTGEIKSGSYLAERIDNWKENLCNVPDTFMTLSRDPRIDHQSPGVEWYKNEHELICMLRTKNS